MSKPAIPSVSNLLFCLLIFFGPGAVHEVQAQFRHRLFSSNMLFETKLHYGFIYPQHLEMEIFNAHFPALEFSVAQMTYGKHRWERDYNYPIVGIAGWISGVGNSSYLGKVYALMPYVNFPLYRHKDFSAGFRVALGAGYVTRPFDRISNYKNLAIGSHLNAAVNLMLEARYRLNYYLILTGGISLQHFSNGSLKLPNYGLNMPMVNAGVCLRPFKENNEIDDRFMAPTDPYEAIVYRSVEITLGGLAGYKNMQAVLGQNFTVLHVFGNSMFRLGKISKAGAGFDLSYDPSHLRILERNGDTVDSPVKVMRPGLNAAYQLVMSKVGLTAQLGSYLGGREKSNGPLYQKFTFTYAIRHDLFAAVMLKVHWGRADYIGWGLGYKFNVRYGKRTIR